MAQLLNTSKSLVSLVTLLAFASQAHAQACGFKPAFSQPDERGKKSVRVYRGAPIAALGGVRPLLVVSDLKLNTDGALISYNETDPTGRKCAKKDAPPCAINNVRNAFINHKRPESDFIAVRDAGYPPKTTWTVLSPKIIEKDKATGQPCRTKDGYLVSMTADVAVAGGWSRVGDCDPSKWIDALSVPAMVVPGASQFTSFGVRKRSLVVALTPAGTSVGGIVGDTGPADEIGEANVAMNRALNRLPTSDRPKHRQDGIDRFQVRKAAVLFFPTNTFVLARPLTPARVETASADALQKFGGLARLRACVKAEVDSAF